jgi:pimeloyl-ACP methyl ester carboxylesterase
LTVPPTSASFRRPQCFGVIVTRSSRSPRQSARSFDGGSGLKYFDGCGHYLHQQQPEAFVTAVGDFLDDPSAVAVRLKS